MALKIQKSHLSRTPPYNTEFEQAVLACCILDGGQDSLALCTQEKISENSFYLPAHIIIFRTILDLVNANIAVNELILIERLRSKNQLEQVGGVEYVTFIANRIDTPAHLKYYATRVRDLELTRKIICVANDSIEQAYAGVDDVNVFLNDLEQSIFSISENRVSETIVHVKKPIDAAYSILKNITQNRESIQGIASGFTDLDKMTAGFKGGEMIVLAARPSVGKTSFAMNIAENVILPLGEKPAVPTLFFSLEMSSEQLATRLLCCRSNVDMEKLRSGFISKDSISRISNASKEIQQAPLWIDESSGLSINEMRAKARRMYNKHKIGLIIIDYLQLISSTDSKMPREQQISEISRGIKAMAKELNVPVIVLSQLNRASEKERRAPRLSDLRESGAIEQDADVVMILAKPIQKDDDVNSAISSDVSVRDLIIAKQRNGAVGAINLIFRNSLTRFENYISN